MNIEDVNRVVIKVGTSTLTHETGMLNLRRVEVLVRVLADIINMGKEVVLVSSGAIGVGAPHLVFPSKRPVSTIEKQAAAAIGQSELMNIYSTFFLRYSRITAQLLLTKDVIDMEDRKQNAINTLNILLSQGIIPIVNENDTISTYEIEFGDNDTLSAHVAQLCNADLLILMTDIDGLYDKDPRDHEDAHFIPVVENISREIFDMAGGTGSKRGTGGMKTKITAAEIAVNSGCDMIIINGARPENLYDIFDGKQIGTLFNKQVG